MLNVTTMQSMTGTLLEDAHQIRVPGMGANPASYRCHVGSVNARGVEGRWLITETPDFAKNYHSQRWRLLT